MGSEGNQRAKFSQIRVIKNTGLTEIELSKTVTHGDVWCAGVPV
jgi:hypothetical protein